MLKPLDWKTTSYKYKDGFIVEVTEIHTKNDIEYYVYLSHENYGVKNYMYGVFKKNLEEIGCIGWDGLSRLILGSIDEYIEMYWDEVY